MEASKKMAPAYHSPNIPPTALPTCVEEQQGPTTDDNREINGNGNTISNNDTTQDSNSYYTRGNQELATETALTLERLEAVRIVL